jgi:putative CocE/NonD family hydrolase
VSDPAKPVPYTAEIRNTQGHLWMVEDQRFASTRPDVLVYQTEPLEKDVTIAGPILARLYVTSTGTDSDWVVKLIDVYPPDAPDNDPNPKDTRMGGFQMMLAGDVLRGKFRTSYEHPQPLVPGQVTKIELNLLDKHHTFLKGHRIMVQVQSSWFPLIDRNPQKSVNIFEAVEGDFQKATNRLYRSPRFSSHIELRALDR